MMDENQELNEEDLSRAFALWWAASVGLSEAGRGASMDMNGFARGVEEARREFAREVGREMVREWTPDREKMGSEPRWEGEGEYSWECGECGLREEGWEHPPGVLPGGVRCPRCGAIGYGDGGGE